MTAEGLDFDGAQLPRMQTAAPGPASISMVDVLARSECPAITARRARRARESGVGQDPIVWSRALGANVEDVDGNLYVDLTSAFAVSGLGHRHPEVVAAAHRQLDRLIHAMGDVYPSDAKIAFTEKLSQVAPGALTQSILGLSGASAIEAALKTAVIHTGKPGVIAFWGGYHGLSHGALAATAYRENFRAPFLSQLNPHIRHIPYPDPHDPPFGMPAGTPPEQVTHACLTYLRQMLTGPATGGEGIGAILIEPIQGRGGEIEPSAGFLAGLREVCDEYGVVLIFDEIYTGFARTGDMFACQHEREGVLPDILCVGKAMGGGFPLSAAIGTAEVMGSWGTSSGEAVHTSTFLGNPLGCAMATASLEVLVRDGWPAKVREKGAWLTGKLEALCREYPQHLTRVRGRGLMLGLELTEGGKPAPLKALTLMTACRDRGFLVLPSGVQGHILALSPPFVITQEQLEAALEAIREILDSL